MRITISKCFIALAGACGVSAVVACIVSPNSFVELWQKFRPHPDRVYVNYQPPIKVPVAIRRIEDFHSEAKIRFDRSAPVDVWVESSPHSTINLRIENPDGHVVASGSVRKSHHFGVTFEPIVDLEYRVSIEINKDDNPVPHQLFVSRN